MKPIKGYAAARAYTEQERLPAGGYVVQIKNVEYQDNSAKGYGDVIVLSFDIAEGEYKDYYAQNYRNQQGEDKKWKGTYRVRVPKDDGSEQDNWAQRRLKTDISAFEESNSGYHWDWQEQGLKGKLVGIVFNNKEWGMETANGYRSGWFTNAHHLISAENARNGKFKLPADQLLKNKPEDLQESDGWMNIPDGVDSDALPFN